MPLHYTDYLHLDSLLSCQAPRSMQGPRLAHDEMLFIITHQAYELWFKQIIFELTGNQDGISMSANQPPRAVMPIMMQRFIPSSSLTHAVSALERIHAILKLLLQQVDVLESMQPLDFLDFRNALSPASGFQSGQYRIIETLLGLRPEQRVKITNLAVESVLSERDRVRLEQVGDLPSVHELLDDWLDRTPFIRFQDFDFWSEYKRSVEKLVSDERRMIASNPYVTDKAHENRRLDEMRDLFKGIFKEEVYDEQRANGLRRLRYRSFKAALFISLYRQEPMLQVPYRLLSTLVDVDEALTRWRHRHGLMVQRMIGTKVGTGGSRGQEYLRDTTYRHRVFVDLLDLSTYLIPRGQTPALPPHVRTDLQLFFEPNV